MRILKVKGILQHICPSREKGQACFYAQPVPFTDLHSFNILSFHSLKMQHSQHDSRNQADDADTPYPEKGCLNVILDLHSRKSGSKKCGGYHRADKGRAVSADYHCNGRMRRVHSKFVPDSDQYRKQSEEIRIRTE